MDHIWASIDKRVKEDMLKDYGFFLESKAGCAIAEGTAEQIFKYVSMFARTGPARFTKSCPTRKAKTHSEPS